DDRQDDPQMVNDGWVGPGDTDRDRRARHAREHGVAGGRGAVHPMQREDEQGRGDEVPELADAVRHVRPRSPRWSSVLNIFSIRSLLRNPLTMFVIEVTIAIAPSARSRGG